MPDGKASDSNRGSNVPDGETSVTYGDESLPDCKDTAPAVLRRYSSSHHSIKGPS